MAAPKIRLIVVLNPSGLRRLEFPPFFQCARHATNGRPLSPSTSSTSSGIALAGTPPTNVPPPPLADAVAESLSTPNGDRPLLLRLKDSLFPPGTPPTNVTPPPLSDAVAESLSTSNGGQPLRHRVRGLFITLGSTPNVPSVDTGDDLLTVWGDILGSQRAKSAASVVTFFGGLAVKYNTKVAAMKETEEALCKKITKMKLTEESMKNNLLKLENEKQEIKFDYEKLKKDMEILKIQGEKELQTLQFAHDKMNMEFKLLQLTQENAKLQLTNEKGV